VADKNVFISYGQYYIILFSYIKHKFNTKKIDDIKGNSDLLFYLFRKNGYALLS